MRPLFAAIHTMAVAIIVTLPNAHGDDRLLVPPGFRVDHYADDELAHDIHSMTIDPKGRVVVSGPGYIRILIDSDSDGKADEYKQFADGPAKGAQGLCFVGSSLVFSGGDGLMIYHDKNGDDKADGPPTSVLNIAAGAEHHVHSIRRGPDGWWYVIAGNMAGVDDQYAALPTSPIRKPEAGVLLRLQPDLSRGEVVADGFRNAYDFAFNQAGDVFTFDSDGERDVSLPWYRPCRVFQVTPRSHAGWVSRSWKHPNDFLSMPPTVAEFGRGSPTGVVCYRHNQFPSRYRNSLFVLDWTFGRILTLPLKENSGAWQANPAIFAKGSGNFGFAPTDIEVGADGELFVCCGGRGTRGSVYRIVSEVNPPQQGRQPGSDTKSKLDYVLQAPQPESSWSREEWLSVAMKLGSDAFSQAAINESRRPDERVRAIEILQSNFDGLDSATATELCTARSKMVRARTAWAIGRNNAASPDANTLLQLLNDESPLVQRSALEALTSATNQRLLDKCLPKLAVAFGSPELSVQSAASNVANRLSVRQQEQLLELLKENLPARVRVLLGVMHGRNSVDADIAQVAIACLQAESKPEVKLQALRLLQLSLGDVGPSLNVPPALESYTARGSLASLQAVLANIKTVLASQMPSGNEAVDRELVRCLAMTGSGDVNMVPVLLQGITAESNPIDDIHRLAALACVNAKLSDAHTQATADALLGLEEKIGKLELKQDSNWDDRIAEIYGRLCETNTALPKAIALHSSIGLPGHVLFLKHIPAQQTQSAIDGFARQILNSPDFQWSTDVVFVLGNSTNSVHRDLIRNQAQNPAVADAVSTVLARKPDVQDREAYVRGLDSSQPKAIAACVAALSKLPRNNEAAEQFQLVALAGRLNKTDEEYRLRESVIRLLQNNMSKSFGFVFGSQGYQSQTDAIRRWEDFLAQRFPQSQPKPAGGILAERVMEVLDEVQWDDGNVARGKQLFDKLQCARCHGGRKAMGPDLQGVARRFSRHDLFASIVDPNRDVSSRYQMTTVETVSGQIYSGMVVYESVDGILLRDANQSSIRIVAKDIASKQKQRLSLMPMGLLKTASRRDLADLDAYLRQL